MRIAAISDLHGHIGISMPECDAIVIAGDIVPSYSSAEIWQSHKELYWIAGRFSKTLNRWVAESGCEICFVMPGNHDVCMADHETRYEVERVLNSIHRVAACIPQPGVSVVRWESLSAIWNFYPWTPTIQDRNWAYSLSRSSRANPASEIDDDCDILVSHGPPLGLLDSVDRKREGCSRLMHRMLEVGPALTICGHIHEERSKRARYFDLKGMERKIVNASICDERYNPSGSRVQVVDL